MADKKSRHWCLTAYLVLMIVGNSVSALQYMLGSDSTRKMLHDAPGWTLPVLIFILLFNLVCVIALFQWKKWGFWGFCVSNVVSLEVLPSIGLDSVLVSVFGIALLYGVLHIGKENKGWPQLD
ncbi:MAG: hypothetical protein HY809_03795 [Nitrospirae bacterium]|nr:hypothetical protein [Nitrospirota bacterium]